jgi:hyperosmotically inducible periplasmic protein
MKFFAGLIVGLVLGALGYYFIEDQARKHPETEKRYEQSARDAGASASDAAHHLSDALRAKLDTFDLHSDKIKEELARTGKVVRVKTKELAGKVADATADARVVASIKTKYASDSELSVWSISVSCSNGHVTLSGTVPTADGIGKAVALALEVDGVQDVSSTLQIKPKT